VNRKWQQRGHGEYLNLCASDTYHGFRRVLCYLLSPIYDTYMALNKLRRWYRL